MQLNLLYRFLLCPDDKVLSAVTNTNTENNLPFVTIQLPLFNEKYVVERLIDKLIKTDYPKEKFEIHILDDSTDDTLSISRRKAEEYRTKGYNITLLQRDVRTGYKAGALRDGLPFAKGEFIAIFDADFLPENDFLSKTMAAFEDPTVGVVQTRWDHINQSYSLLTELQAFQLNVHFTIEQKGRFNADYMLQFNGTAGIWRKACIIDAGGWETDTLTEDLDLSYRAQLKGWKIIYLQDVTAPAELPSEINGLKSQQFRWMKGGAETARKLIHRLWTSDKSFGLKVQATGHLLSSTVFVFVFIMSILSFPLLFLSKLSGISIYGFSIFLGTLLAVILVYYVANVSIAWPKKRKFTMILKFIFLFPVFLAISMALAFHNSIAVLQGWFGRKSSFVRTPKYGITGKKTDISGAVYFQHKIDWIALGEGMLGIYFFIALYFGWMYHMKEFLLMHLLLAMGYLSLFIYAIQSRLTK